jgi:glycosyltransferase involved in cell wall biosynthesis
MAAGRPIIACLNGEGAKLVLEAGAGFATPAEDAKALADTILLLYSQSSDAREIMGDKGRKYYQEHFNHDRLIDQLIVLLKNTSNKRNCN